MNVVHLISGRPSVAPGSGRSPLAIGVRTSLWALEVPWSGRYEFTLTTSISPSTYVTPPPPPPPTHPYRTSRNPVMIWNMNSPKGLKKQTISFCGYWITSGRNKHIAVRLSSGLIGKIIENLCNHFASYYIGLSSCAFERGYDQNTCSYQTGYYSWRKTDSNVLKVLQK